MPQYRQRDSDDDGHDSLAEAIAAHTDESAEEIRDAADDIDISPPWDADVVEQE